MSVREEGKAKWLNDEERFAFIEQEGEKCLYAHQIRKKQFELNRLGQRGP